VGSGFLLFAYLTIGSLYTSEVSYPSWGQIGLGSLLVTLIVECILYKDSYRGTSIALYPTSHWYSIP
jgi:hypothetical protein